MKVPNPYFFYQLYFYFTKPVTRKLIEKIEDCALSWPYVSTGIHSFGGKEFTIDGQEFGHIHWNGDLDIAFNKALVNMLIEEKIADKHKFVPAKAITYKIKYKTDIGGALHLLNLSYLIWVKKAVRNDPDLLDTINLEIKKLPFNLKILSLT